MSLFDVKLLTGRTHQARVQLKALGSPIAGDAKYGGDVLKKGYNLALWAYQLTFVHPTTKNTMVFNAHHIFFFVFYYFNIIIIYYFIITI